jgi:hypothetical protein
VRDPEVRAKPLPKLERQLSDRSDVRRRGKDL